MKNLSTGDFEIEKDCSFEGEHYSVRDNGAVLRHSREGKRVRASDNEWTFGNVSASHPYLHISNVRVHRIVATAFHGEPADPKFVVDHIDTNCRNNRPENLRWLSRLENALKNPITRKKIEYLCGSIEAFLENPSILNERQIDPIFSWMRTVTREEAQNCMMRMLLWAGEPNKQSSQSYKERQANKLGEKVFKPLSKIELFGREPGLELSLTPWCAEYMFLKKPVYFSCCPESFQSDPIEEYFQEIKSESIFAHGKETETENESFKLITIESVMLKEHASIIVICKRADQEYLVVGIKLDNKTKWFIHFNLGVYSDMDKAKKAFTEKQNLKDFWSDGYKNAYK